MSRVLVNSLKIRTEPSINSQVLDKYNSGEVIKSGDQLIFNEGRYWLRYTGGSGNKRYVCAWDSDGSKFVEVPGNIPGPRPGNSQGGQGDSGWTLTAYCHCSQCCGKSNKITASGYHLSDKDHLAICAAPSNIPFGTVIHISGGWNGTVRCEDRGGAIKGKRLNIYCKTHQEALNFGKKLNCTLKY